MSEYRRRNPVSVIKPGPRIYRGVRIVENRRPAHTRLVVRTPLGYGYGYGFGYGWPYPVAYPVAVPVDPCPIPIDQGRVVVSSGWALDCFWNAYVNARAVWGANAQAITSEIMLQLVPPSLLGEATTGAERELRRRIAMAVAVLLSQDGIPTRLPPNPPTPRPDAASGIRVPWLRALVTGWV